MTGKLIGRTEVAGILDVHESSINRVFAANEGPAAIKIGGRYKYRENEVRDWLDKRAKAS